MDIETFCGHYDTAMYKKEYDEHQEWKSKHPDHYRLYAAADLDHARKVMGLDHPGTRAVEDVFFGLPPSWSKTNN